MSTEYILSLLPEMYLGIGTVALLGFGVLERGGRVSQIKNVTYLTIAVLIGTLLLESRQSESGEALAKIVLIGSGIVVLLVSLGVYEDRRAKIADNEYGQIVSLGILGMILMMSAKDMIMMYLAIETMSLSLYILASIRKTGQYSTEAGLKYMVLGALSSGIILLGISIIYVLTGTVRWEGLALYLAAGGAGTTGVVLGGLVILVAVLFKLGAAPLHMWVPDVYEGAPTIVTTFFAAVPKLGVVVLLIGLVSHPLLGAFVERIQPFLIGVGIISVIVGSIAAVNQTKIKRLMAYSAIAHMGWVILGVGVGTEYGYEASILYMILYMIMTINSFTLITNIYQPRGNNYIIELSGLARRSPVLAFTFAISLLSTAGIPPLAGFYSKYNLIIALLDEGWIITSIVGIVVSVIGAFYYIRVIQMMYFNDTKAYVVKEMIEVARQYRTATVISQGILGVSVYIIMTYLINPNPLIVLANQIVEGII